ncbi:MAG: hypothetical protein ACI8SE_002205 [Bacteroidia bacterium]|jgi:hypothetical protein
MKSVFLLLSICLTATCWAQSTSDTVLSGGRKAKFHIEVIPCECDSLKHDSVSISNSACFDTNSYLVVLPSILDVADSICIAMGVPPKLIYEIGMNESRWQNIYDLDFLIKDGDLQVIDRTFNHFYSLLALQGGKTRHNYLIIGIYYLKQNFNTYQSWEKARYAYGRGRWKSKSDWTSLERKFMTKIDWTQYD